MLKTITPYSALAQPLPSRHSPPSLRLAPAASAKASLTGSHKSQLRRQANLSKERTRTSAHHVRHLKPKTLTP